MFTYIIDNATLQACSSRHSQIAGFILITVVVSTDQNPDSKCSDCMSLKAIYATNTELVWVSVQFTA